MHLDYESFDLRIESYAFQPPLRIAGVNVSCMQRGLYEYAYHRALESQLKGSSVLLVAFSPQNAPAFTLVGGAIKIPRLDSA
jgi:hypothetical protein